MKLKWTIFAALGICLPLVAAADPAAEIARAAAQRQQVIIVPQAQQIQPADSEDETARAATNRQQVSAQRNPTNVSSQATAPQAGNLGRNPAPVVQQSRTAIVAQPETARSVVTRRGVTAGAEAQRAGDTSRVVRSGAADLTETKTVQARDQNTARRATGRDRDPNARQTVAEVGGRAVIARTGEYTSSNYDQRGNNRNNRVSRARSATESPMDSMIESMVKDAALTSCSAKYEECMDQFCNIIDEKQQRCSCSANLKNYREAEDELKRANQDLNTVAQNIRYVGLTGEEIRTLFTETEAEEAMRMHGNDTSNNRKLLAEIEDIISGATSNLTPTGGKGGGSMFEINLDGEFDMNDVFGSLGGGGSSMANLRGKQLRDAAAKKCKVILDECRKEGVAQDRIINSYDLRIEKDCLEYEQTLVRMHESVSNNIRSAGNMLQKARLAVLYDQNEYDFKGCVQALDQCVLEDTACGKNYIRCLDPDRTYLDEAGKVIQGNKLPNIMVEFEKITQNGTVDYLGTALDNLNVLSSKNSVIYNLLKNKIGNFGGEVSGMCSDVMKRCRRLTFDTGVSGQSPKKNSENEVLKAFLSKAANQMSAAASRVVADHANRCLQDVGTCYNTQVTNISAWTSGFTNVSPENVKNIMLGACRSVSLTCAQSIFFVGLNDDKKSAKINCFKSGTSPTCDDDDHITQLSEIFYHSLLCGPNMIYSNKACYCMEGYELVGGFCRMCSGSKKGTSCTITATAAHWFSTAVTGTGGATGNPQAHTTTCCAEVK